jgi:ABC-type sugar transport system permease subunit
VVYVLYVPLSTIIGLVLALVLHAHRGRWGAGLLRTGLLLPYVTSAVGVSLIWQLIYQSGSLGVGKPDWLSNPMTALWALMVMSIWATVGGQALVFLMGLQRIPSPYLEAARLDGANAWQRFWRVTFPLLRPVTAFVLVTTLINAFQVFTYVYVLTGGGPAPHRSTEVLVHHIYQVAWGSTGWGIAAAEALLLMLVLLVLTSTRLKLLGRQTHA